MKNLTKILRRFENRSPGQHMSGNANRSTCKDECDQAADQAAEPARETSQQHVRDEGLNQWHCDHLFPDVGTHNHLLGQHLWRHRCSWRYWYCCWSRWRHCHRLKVARICRRIIVAAHSGFVHHCGRIVSCFASPLQNRAKLSFRGYYIFIFIREISSKTKK